MAAVDKRFVTEGLAKYEYCVLQDGNLVGVFRTDDSQSRHLVESFANRHMERLHSTNPGANYTLETDRNKTLRYFVGWGCHNSDSGDNRVFDVASN